MLPKQSAALHQVMRLVLAHVLALAALCAHSSVLAQASTLQLDTTARQAGMFQAFRICLKQERDADQISADDYRRCDSTAERIYFGLYNTFYAQARNISIATQFVNEAQKIVYGVKGNPERCQQDATFDKVSADIEQDIKGFYPNHPDVHCGLPLPCGMTAKDAREYQEKIKPDECVCPLAKVKLLCAAIEGGRGQIHAATLVDAAEQCRQC